MWKACDDQYDFRVGMSTAQAVHNYNNLIVQDLDNRKKCMAILLDLTKVFDPVSHPIILFESLGRRGSFSYFSFAEPKWWSPHQLRNSPGQHIRAYTIYLFYFNDLCNLPTSGGHLTAFDEKYITSAQLGFDKVSKWLKYNLLTLNKSKTKYLTFSIINRHPPDPSNPNITAHIPHCSHVLAIN